MRRVKEDETIVDQIDRFLLLRGSFISGSHSSAGCSAHCTAREATWTLDSVHQVVGRDWVAAS